MARHRTHPIAFKRLIFSKPDQGHGARRARTSWAWPNPNHKLLPRAFHQPEGAPNSAVEEISFRPHGDARPVRPEACPLAGPLPKAEAAIVSGAVRGIVPCRRRNPSHSARRRGFPRPSFICFRPAREW